MRVFDAFYAFSFIIIWNFSIALEVLNSMKSWTKLSRVYVASQASNFPWEVGKIIEVGDTSLVHYMKNVIRLKEGSQIRMFNDLDGEFICRLLRAEISKRSQVVSIEIIKKIRSIEATKDSWRANFEISLYFSPIRKENVKLVLEKGTELGVDRFIPLLTKFCQHQRLFKQSQDSNKDLLSFQNIIIQSSEQSERLSIPSLCSAQTVPQLIQGRKDCYDKSNDCLFLCKERSVDIPPLLTALRTAMVSLPASPPQKRKVGLIVGPEGGFEEEEYQLLSSVAQPVSLGENTLRAETAAITALGCIQQFLEAQHHLR